MIIPFNDKGGFIDWLNDIQKDNHTEEQLNKFWEDLEEELRTFDWFFNHSDDFREFTKGELEQKNIIKRLKFAVKIHKDRTLKLLEKYHKNHTGFNLFELLEKV